MSRVFQVMIREYKSTVLTKAFVFGAFVFPVVFYTLLIVVPMFIQPQAPKLTGEILVYDATGASLASIRQQFQPTFIEAQANAIQDVNRKMREGRDQTDAPEGMLDELGGGDAFQQAAVRWAQSRAFPWDDQPAPDVEITPLETSPIDASGLLKDEFTRRIRDREMVAVVFIGEEALRPMSRNQILVYTRDDLNPKNLEGVQYGVRQGVLMARLANRRMSIEDQLAFVPPFVSAKSITEAGERTALGEESALFLTLGFMMLLWISTFTGGQYLLMSTVEEKSSRVMEVLLSAVSSMQLMTGKIFGQAGVALTMLAVYAAVAILGLNRFDYGYLISTEKLAIFAPYFFMAFMFVACMMATVGSAVNDVREANALMGPVMMVMIVPFLLMIPIAQNANSTLAVVASFIPPITPFIMAMRLGGAQQIPYWQIAATQVIGWAAVFGAIWFTAKVFRIGVLMYGKAPNVKTLLSWVRQA